MENKRQSSHLMSLILYKTFFVVKIHDMNLMPVMYNVLYNLKTYTYVWNKYARRLTRKEDKSYYSVDPEPNTYRFPIAMLKEVMSTFGRHGVKREDVFLFREYNKEVEKLNLNFKYDKYTPRDYQDAYINILLNERNSKPVMLVDLQTGAGKGLIGSCSLTKLNEKVMILVLPKYVDKWISDIKMYTDIKDSEICTIQGSKSIATLMDTPHNFLNKLYKVYIASVTTMNYLISDYEDGKYPYNLTPTEFMPHLGVGVILNDETHQHFHALLKVSLYMNVNQIIGLSATLDSNRAEMKKMYERMFPQENRISNILKIEKYTNVRAIEYKMNTLRGIKFTQSSKGYSHVLFEQSILKKTNLIDDYFDMVYYYVKRDFLNRRKDGEKLLVFFSTVAMCTMFTNYLKKKHPDMDIRKYTQEDPYENIVTATMSVSTIISASTAVDIPKLITVINTISMASLQANLQTMGRLRKIPGREVWYVYMYNPEIPNQRNMHKIRRDTIMKRSKVIYYDTYPNILKNY